jgi:itaconate CoA-transferase
LRGLITEAFAGLTAEQLVQRLEQAQIANASVNDMQAVWEHPQLQARGRWTLVDTPSGKVPALLPPGHTEAYSPRMDAVPALGQHTAAILAELGLGDAEITALRAAEAV